MLVRITHCSIARGDVQYISDDWSDANFPLVPGHEIIGIIENTGSNVTGLKIGDRVGVGYQLEACFECEFCKEGNEQFCPHRKEIAVDRYGGLAEHIIVDNRFAFPITANLDSAKAAPLLSSGLTVYSAIVSAGLRNNSTVAVLGIGGLGQLAIQFLHKMGHAVSAFSHSPEKKKLIEQLGATYIDSSNLNSLTANARNFDFILSSTLNADFDLNAYLKLLKPQGKFCFVSSPLKRLYVSVGLLYDYARRTIYGSYTGSCMEMLDMLAFSAEHNIESIVEVMQFAKINEAIEMVKSGKVSERLVLENPQQDL